MIMSVHEKYESISGAAKGKNKKYFRTTHKLLWIRLPTTVDDALEIYRPNGNIMPLRKK